MSETTYTPESGDVEALEFHVTEDHHPETGTLLGFWLYLMSDCLIFACLFATYGVLGRSYAADPTCKPEETLFDNWMDRSHSPA